MTGGVIRHVSGYDRHEVLRRAAERDPGALWLDPEACKQHPLLAVRLRRSVLMRCYNGDYHTDVFEEERLTASVADGSERVLFWGPADVLANTAEMFARGTLPCDAELDTLALGTHTSLRGDELYGPGHLEVARTGSAQTDPRAAREAITWDLGRVLSGERGDSFHTVSCVPRNRRSAPGIPGGTAIHRLHTREVGSWHWGLAPFYVMVGGSLEVLDYRELSIDDGMVRAGFNEGGPALVSDARTAALVEQLCALNGFTIDVRVISSGPAPRVRPSDGPPADPHGPRVVHLDLDYLGERLPRAFARLGEACTVAMIDLEDARSVAVQVALLSGGFVLTYISPPKVVLDPEAAGGRRRVPLRGGFCRVLSSAPLAPPFYLAGGPLSYTEKVLVQQYRKLLATWGRETTNRVER